VLPSFFLVADSGSAEELLRVRLAAKEETSVSVAESSLRMCVVDCCCGLRVVRTAIRQRKARCLPM